MIKRIELIALLFAIFSCISCEKENASSNDNFLIAGKYSTSRFNYFDIKPDTTFQAQSLDQNYDESSIFDIDLNNDSKGDVRFRSYSFNYSYGTAGGRGSKIEIIDSAFMVSHLKNNLNIINLGDTIDYLSNWSREQNLSYLSGPPLTENSLFNDKTFYIGLKSGSKLGWVKVSVEDFNKISVYDCVFEK